MQIGTLSQFGVIMMLFMLGLEFHLSQLHLVWKIGLYQEDLKLPSNTIYFRIHRGWLVHIVSCGDFSNCYLVFCGRDLL